MIKKYLISLVAVLFASAIVTSSVSVSANHEGEAIRIGSKDFTENLLVAEIYALALEAEGFDVERVPAISSAIVHTAITNDEIDLYPEYTGTGLLTVLQLPMETDPEKVFEIVKTEYNEQFDLTWLDYSQANDSQGLVITTAKAEELEIETISDLQAHADELRFASQGEFDMREDGLPGLEGVYGSFTWASSTIYDNSLKYQVLKNDEADVTPAYTTEGQLVNNDLYTVLEDDKQFWPPYNLAPIVRNNVLEAHPEIEEILGEVNDQLDTEKMIELNAKVDVDGEEYLEVAKEFFDSLK
ncbi:glycine betaine ABC transporter substrate-binding protein [Fundicoccus sp. Sow4_D5]|uniref:glycine betaine ABC transporter substrate-binding protein n=1 Tax=Fundicoccus sp. Sow4_D5 TaxID=3438782 RepID=UPI003F917A7A